MTKAMAVYHSMHGVRINCICPGTVETPMVNRLIDSHADPRAMKDEFLQRRMSPYLGTPDDVAKAVAFLLSDDAAFINGAMLAIDGGIIAAG